MDSKVLIVGAGVFGLSAALYFTKSDVISPEDILVLDIFEPPSKRSASNDFNKIIRCEYNKELYTRLSLEALELWRTDPLFSSSYVECGRVLATPLSHLGRLEFEKEGIRLLQSHGGGSKYQFWLGGKNLSEMFEGLKENQIPLNKEVKWNPECGLGQSSNTLKTVYQHLKNLGVRFKFGEDGNVTGVNKEGNVVSANGKAYRSEKVILCLGANTGKVLDLENQQAATGLFVTHIQLSEEEYDLYKDLPVIFDGDMGYFFPPDKETKIMKVCLNGGGIKRIEENSFGAGKISLPRFHDECPADTIPRERVSEVQALLGQYVPRLKNHEIFDSKVCWIGDTVNGHFLIDRVPNLPSVFVATGDSGHGYKFFPNIGKYIVKRVNGELEDEDMSESWKWKNRNGLEMVDPAKNKWRITKGTRDITEIDFL